MSKLKEYRTRLNISKSKLAELVNVSSRHIAFIESGERTPSIELAFKLAKVLNSSVDEMFSPTAGTNSTED